MRESIIFNNQLIMTIHPPLGDDLMLLRDSKGRLFPHSHYLLLPGIALYGQKAYFELYPCNPSRKISRDTQIYMSHDILYSSHSDILKSMTLFEDTIESLNDRPLLIETREGFTLTDRPHYILCFIILLEIKDWSVLSLPADGAKQTSFGFLFVEAAAEFESLSFGFSSPVSQLESCFAGILPILSNDDVSSLDRIFSTPWVFCNDRGNIILNQIGCIFCGVISCISDYCINSFIYFLEVFLRFLGQFFEKFPIPFISCRYLYGQGDGQFCISNLKMDLVAEEAEVFAFPAPAGIRIGFFGFDVRGVDREAEVFFFDKAEGLGDEIHDDLTEGFLSESLSEVVESVVFRGISVGESTEVGESSIVAEFSGEVSFGGGVAEVDEQEGFEEANRVIAFSTLIGVFIFGEVVDEGEVDLLVEDFQGVVRWDDGCYFYIYEC